MAKRIRIYEHGGPEVLKLEDYDVTQPGPGEALIRNTAIGLNFIETYFRSGLYPPPGGLPCSLGTEAAGVVEAVGPGVTEVSVGQRVAHCSGPLGAYSDLRVMPAERLVPLPDAISNDVAAAIMLKGLTAWYLLRQTYVVKPGETILFHSAAGGVGLIACQWARHLGVNVIGTAGGSEKMALAKANGCAHVIDSHDPDISSKVRELTGGKGVPVVYDGVGKATFTASLDSLQPRGLLVSYGNASGAVEAFNLGILSAKGSLYVTRPTLFTYTATREQLLAGSKELFDVVASGAVKIQINQRFKLSDVADAHRALQGRATTGSTLLIP
ncbi:MAG: quinone oxidoreductase [Geminicoccaceae bacterium]